MSLTVCWKSWPLSRQRVEVCGSILNSYTQAVLGFWRLELPVTIQLLPGASIFVYACGTRHLAKTFCLSQASLVRARAIALLTVPHLSK
jgi:hypothetical protein